jgi:hypothetical protein
VSRSCFNDGVVPVYQNTKIIRGLAQLPVFEIRVCQFLFSQTRVFFATKLVEHALAGPESVLGKFQTLVWSGSPSSIEHSSITRRTPIEHPSSTFLESRVSNFFQSRVIVTKLVEHALAGPESVLRKSQTVVRSGTPSSIEHSSITHRPPIDHPSNTCLEGRVSNFFQSGVFCDVIGGTCARGPGAQSDQL